MTDKLQQMAQSKRARMEAGLERRYAREKRFRIFGIASIGLACLFLVVMLGSIVVRGYSAFVTTEIRLDLVLDEATLGISDTSQNSLFSANYNKVIRESLKESFPDVSGRKERRALYGMVSNGAAYALRDYVMENPELVGQAIEYWARSGVQFNQFNKGNIDRNLPERSRKFKDQQIAWYDSLKAAGDVRTRFNHYFFTNGDSRDPEMAGIRGALVGSFLTLTVTLLLSFPIGVATAIYLEEFAPKNRLTELIEININNLAAVPSIVFGLLGLAIFLNFADLPRSTPIVGGMVLTLMTLPTIIISSRAAIKSVPPSIRDGALGMGASKMQVVFHHVLPLAMPGMLTGTIIGMAQALGETAPLMMIGMVAFIVDVPDSLTSPSTALPVQIFLWAGSPEKGFVENTAGAIMVLLAFLALMNASAVYLRKRLERRW